MSKRSIRDERKTVICDDCLTAAYDEGAQTREEQEIMCTTIGNEITDHTCLCREGDQSRCDCLCNRNE